MARLPPACLSLSFPRLYQPFRYMSLESSGTDNVPIYYLRAGVDFPSSFLLLGSVCPARFPIALSVFVQLLFFTWSASLLSGRFFMNFSNHCGAFIKASFPPQFDRIPSGVRLSFNRTDPLSSLFCFISSLGSDDIREKTRWAFAESPLFPFFSLLG